MDPSHLRVLSSPSPPSRKRVEESDRPWLLPLAPLGKLVPPETDARYGAAALAARDGDVTARDALFAAFAPRARLAAARVWRRHLDGAWQIREEAVERGDLEQEAYLLFLQLVASWPGEASFSGFVTRLLPWRLSNRLRQLRGRSARSLERDAIPEPQASGGGGDLPAAFATLTARLSGREVAMLRWRILDGVPMSAIADRLGVSRRTASRDWRRLLATMRMEFD